MPAVIVGRKSAASSAIYPDVAGNALRFYAPGAKLAAARSDAEMIMEIRLASREDAPEAQLLLRQLGYDLAMEELAARLGEFSARAGDPVLVAADGGKIIGLIALHWAVMLHVAQPVARITALVVREDARGGGVGRALVEAGAERAARAGCGLLELTTGLRRADAQAFYEAIGFRASALRLVRSLYPSTP
jgi:GNAT superfamily N-acetyltransferase